MIAMSLSPTVNIYTVRGGHCTTKTLWRLIPPWKLAGDVLQCKFPHVQWTELSHSHQCLQGITYFTAVPIRTYFELWNRLLAQDGAAAYNLLLEPVITLRNGPQHLHFPLGIESHILFSEWKSLWTQEVNALTWPWRSTEWRADLQIRHVEMCITSTAGDFSVNNAARLCMFFACESTKLLLRIRCWSHKWITSLIINVYVFLRKVFSEE